RLALCYEIDGYVWGYRDATFLSVDYSLRPADVAEAYERIERIVAALSKQGPTAGETERAGAYAAGATALTFDSVAGRAEHAIELIMDNDDDAVEPELYVEAVESVTRDDLTDLAGRVAPGPCVACVGAVAAGTFGQGEPPGDALKPIEPSRRAARPQA